MQRAMHNGGMFLRCTLRVKDGKEHRYWSIVENRRGSSRRVVQRQVLYLGEINDSQKSAWCRCIEVFEEPRGEWRLHREWYLHSAMADLLGRSGEAMELQSLYRCQDKLLAHKAALFSFLRERWQDLFHVEFEVLLYDLTSTYFECDPPASGKRRFGYSRDKRPDCVQVIIALVVTPDGLPLTYEVMAGNTSEKTTLKSFLDKIEKQYGQAKRVWVMDRGIPTEQQLKDMSDATSPVAYLS